MIDFKTPEVTDADWVRRKLNGSGRMGSEACFGNLYMWCDAYNCSLADVDGMLVCRAGDSFTYPVGDGDAKAVVEKLMAFAEDRGQKLRFHSMNEESKEELDNFFPGLFEFEETRDTFDYIYSVEDLAVLSGKKYHGKRNHISFFEANFDWSYEQMTAETAKECMEFSDYWYRANKEKAETGTDKEMVAIHKALENFDALGIVGGILRVQGDIVAYTFGEPISDKLFCTHVEKAVANIRGAYPMINREFAKNSINTYELVNREEDLGLPGLRRAKESYRPKILLTKYSARQK